MIANQLAPITIERNNIQGLPLLKFTQLLVSNVCLSKDPDILRLYILKLIESFSHLLIERGFSKVNIIPLCQNTGFDLFGKKVPRTGFVGCGTDPLMPLFIEKSLNNGIFVSGQPSLRSQSIQSKILFDSEKSSYRKSNFWSLCAVVPMASLDELIESVLFFYIDTVGIPINQLCVKISTKDKDLCAAFYNSSYSKDNLLTVLEDTEQDKYYTHVYGMQNIVRPSGTGFDVVGRNFNLAIWNSSFEKYMEIGNIIIIESTDGVIYGVEAGFGTTTTLSHILNCKHTTQVGYVYSQIQGHSHNENKIRDYIESAVSIAIDWFTFCGSENYEFSPFDLSSGRCKTFVEYCKGIRYLSKLLKITGEKLKEVIRKTIDFELKRQKNSIMKNYAEISIVSDVKSVQQLTQIIYYHIMHMEIQLEKGLLSGGFINLPYNSKEGS